MSSDRTLPLRIRQNIRDDVDSSTSPLAHNFDAISKTLGYPVKLDPEWSMLWTSLQPYYPDQSTFIPNIIAIILGWCDAFSAFLDNEENEELIERMLEDLAQARGATLKVVPEVDESNASRPVTRWRSKEGSFVIAFPKARPNAHASASAGFTTDMLALFKVTTPTHPAQTPETSQTMESTQPEDPEAWDELTDDTPLTPSTFQPSMKARPGYVQQGDDVLPHVSTIDRPEELTKRPPYILTVRQEGKTKVVVQCSHHGSLVLLEAYLKKWTRTRPDYVDRPPMVNLTLLESSFGLGLLYDSLVLEAGRHKEVSAMMVLVFVESVLGYEPVGRDADYTGSIWEFKRLRAFK